FGEVSMNTFRSVFRLVILLVATLASGSTWATDEAIPEAMLKIANRNIVMFRAAAQGAPPEKRVERITARIRAMDERDLSQPITRSPLEVGDVKGVLFSIGDQTAFLLLEKDLEGDEQRSLDQVAAEVEIRFAKALQALVDHGHGAVLIKGVLYSVVATVIMFALLLGIQKATTFVLDRLQQRIQSANENTKLRWAAQGWLLVKRVAHLVLLALWLAVAYMWLTYVLGNFPLTQPFAEQLSQMLFHSISHFANGTIAAIPSLVSVAIILFLAKAANDVAGNVFNNVALGRSLLPGVHKETAGATRRIVAVVIWGVAIAIAYPYLPLAESNAFKGLSVMFGFMLTLGSAGIVTQLMGGLVLIYSRALKVGDFVCIGDVTGVVKEMSALSTKIINMRNEEVTIPNAVLVGSAIKNYTGATGERGALVSTTVTIGYDTPWRQVHAMLINAAERTSGLRNQPKPFVMQKALQDYYVEYELYAYVDRPLERIQILSELHSHIQDEFNTYGVQIMSPHFVLQPKNNVVVNKENWFSEPAEPPPPGKS
ncbi:MAG: mechanosensitive ion channel family protein, partial [Azonexus sp.]